MSYVEVWIHAVWGTKHREHLLTNDVRPVVKNHFLHSAKKKQIYIDRLNGSTEHLHCLLALNADRSVAKTLQLIKGESAHWINKEQATPLKFEWADEYYAVSVSQSDLPAVRAYIDNQEEHHKKRTFAEDVEEFMRKHNLSGHGESRSFFLFAQTPSCPKGMASPKGGICDETCGLLEPRPIVVE